MQSILIVIIRQCGQNKRNYGFNIQSISKDHFMNKISELSKDNSTSLMKEIASNEILMAPNINIIYFNGRQILTSIPLGVSLYY